MSNPNHVKILQQGVEAWNEWYSVKSLLTNIDLSGVNLHGANLRSVNLSGVNLMKADLRGANLQDANLRGAKLVVANLSGANLQSANLSESDLRCADLSKANLARVQALNSDFSEAVVTGACIEGWIIDRNTKFAGMICFYVYLKANQRERRPIKGFFRSGEGVIVCQQSLVPVEINRSN